MDWATALSQTWPVRLGQTLLNAAKLPGDVYSGATPITDDSGRTNPEVINRAADLAGLVTGGSFVAPAERDAVGMGIRAYHGSPYDFDKFDLSKIGAGEGAQAYGHGLYFAENPEVARFYRDDLAARLNRRPVTLATDGPFAGVQGLEPDPTRLGRMYEVNLNAEPQQFLDWDKPLSQQTAIQPQLNALAGQDSPLTGEYARQVRDMLNAHQPHNTGEGVARLFGFNQAEGTDALKSVGIPGIKYLDQGSRSAGGQLADISQFQTGPNIGKWKARSSTGEMAGPFESQDAARAYSDNNFRKPTSNYVVFNPSIIEILRKYGIAGAVPATTMADALMRYQPQNQESQ